MTDTATEEPGLHRRHPVPRDYWGIAVILAVITAAEVAFTYMGFLGRTLVPLLFIAGTAKFAIVAGWFMHLRFDLKAYTRFFVLGIVLALVLFTVVLATFGAL